MTDKRMLLIVNPRSGKRRGLAVLEQVKSVFTAADVELDVRETEQSGHARQIALEFDQAAYNGLCLIGGDGTIHEAVCGLIERDEPVSIPLGIIPGGTGNDMAQHIGLNGPLDSARRIVSGRTSPFDVMWVETDGQIDYCVNLIGWAGVADINCRAERLRALGPSRYAFAALWQVLFPKRCHAKLVLDDRSIEDDFTLFVACNTIFTGSGMRLAPHAKADDGKMDVVLVRNASRWQMFRLFTKIFNGSHVDMPWVETYQVRSSSILSDGREPLDLDGEIKGTTPVSIHMIPKAVRFFV